ncbi:MAG TPA: sterol desaturase family protein [Tepidisphaeraceae bacterium]|nr:sterol desaturase family protein [Tepidisphaeraceae bacterium]
MDVQLDAFLISIFRLCLWLVMLVVIFVPLERLFAVHEQKIFRKGIATDLIYYFVSSLLPALALSAPIGLVAWAVHRAVPSSFLVITASLPLWVQAIFGLIAAEIGYYWGHRLSHEIPVLWRFHAIHHSAEEVDFLVNTRAHPVDLVFGRFCALVPIYILGLANPVHVSGSLVPIIVTLITTTWGFFIHANIRWRFGPLEWLISTPAFHHWHHTLSGPINRNYASTLPWLDRMFGTHYLPKQWPTAYGIEDKMPDSLKDQLLYPLRPDVLPMAETSVASVQANVVESKGNMPGESL